MKTIGYKLLTLAVLLLSFAGHAQWQNGLWTGLQANNWFFSFNQGLSFASGGPQFLGGGQTAVMEGTAVMSDENGQLLFYASNATVWNQNHQVMQNGDGLLAGSQSSTQDGIIVPKPGSPGIYYLFNVDIVDGLVYSEIDMSLDGGLGAVTANKNIVLQSNARVEKLTAVYHADKERIWVISHREANNEFIAYLVSNAGVAASPVVSAVGHVYTSNPPDENIDYTGDGPAGQLKASPDGSKLAAVQKLGDIVGISITNGRFEVFDFDNSTGQISNPVPLIIPNHAYGVEFSPNSKFLYVLDNLYLPTVGFLGTSIEKVLQYDLTASSASAIAASVTQVGQYTSRYESAMQLGPDGRIYFVNSASLNTLVAIKNPNNAGAACGFQAGYLTIEDSDSLGLPAFIQSYFESGILYQENCGSQVYFSLLRIPDVTLTHWNFGDPASGADNTSDLAYHVFSAPGTYTVTVDVTSNSAVQTVTTQVLVTGAGIAYTPPQDVAQCISTGTTAVFDLTTQQASIMAGLDTNLYTIAYYTSQADADAGTNALTGLTSFTSSGQTIYIRITNTATACHVVTQFNLQVIPAPVAVAVPNLQLCGTGGSAAFDLTTQNAALLLNNPTATVAYFTSLADADANTNAIASTASFTNTVNPQTIYARVGSGGCYAVSQFNLEVTPAPVAPALPNLQLCGTGGSTAFDLTVQNAALLLNNPTATVAYFTSLADAGANTNAIANTASFTNTVNPQTIYARVGSGDCYAVTQFDLQVTPAPVAAAVPNLQLCGTGGSAAFDLTIQNTALLQNNSTATVAYFTSLANADANTNAIANTASFTNTVNPQTIYARVTLGNCYATTQFNLDVTPMPVAVAVPDLQLCGTGGSTAFDLTVQNAALLLNQPTATVTYFTSLANADANTNAIANTASFTNTVNPQTIYARVSNGGCYTVMSFTVLVNELPLAVNSFSITGCPPFSLGTAVTGVANGTQLTYYPTENDAAGATNALTDSEQYTFTGSSSTVYVRAENAAGCISIAAIDITKGGCEIPRGISPNGDTLNDSFDLSFLEVRKLVIYNRYGLEVYSRNNYKNEWYGQADNNNELPTGTYFYVVEPQAGQSKTGWVYINRQTN